MKKQLLRTCIVASIFGAYFSSVAQTTVLNGSFENWSPPPSFNSPVTSQPFGTSNEESMPRAGILTVTEVPGVSNSAMKIETILAGTDTINGMAGWGYFNDGPPTGGVPLPTGAMVTGVSMDIKYSLNVNTPGMVGFIPYKNGVACGVGNGLFPGGYIYPLSGNQSTFTNITYTFSPALLQAPDSLFIIITSADLINTEKGTPGDYVVVDNIVLNGTPDQIIGGDLDTWMPVPLPDMPDEWMVYLDPQQPNYERSTDAKDGQYSLLLRNVSYGADISTGNASLGKWLNCNNGGPCDPDPHLNVPNQVHGIRFYYKYSVPNDDLGTAADNDTASFWSSVIDASGNQISSAYQHLHPASEWTYREVYFNTYSSSIDDSMMISIESGRWQNARAGSTLLIDAIVLHDCDESAVITGPTSLCAGTNGVKFSIPFDFANNYVWSTNNGSIVAGVGNDTVTIDGITANGTVQVIKSYTDGCPDKTFTLNFTTAASSSANPGNDFSVCATSNSVALNGSVLGATNGAWSTSGSGSFSEVNSLNPSYNFSPSDKTNGTVTLTLTPIGTGGCSVTSNDVVITITAAPTLLLSSDQAICANATSITGLSASITVATGVEWTTTGAGAFGNPTGLSTNYTLHTLDATLPVLELVCETTGNGDCAAIRDTVKITISPKPTLYVGTDATVCADASNVNVYGVKSNATTGTWSGGAGTYAPDNTAVTMVYTPTAGEKSAGSVSLTYSTVGTNSCSSMNISDALTITFEQVPTIDAGPAGITSCTTEVVSLSGTAAAPGVSWTSNGTGTFSAPNNIVSNYTPSAADISTGSVTLTLSSTGTSSCAAVTDNIVVTINICSGILDPTSTRAAIFPNPVTHETTVQLDKIHQIQEIQILDISGKAQLVDTNPQTTDVLQLNTSELKAGVYQLIVKTMDGRITSRFVKK